MALKVWQFNPHAGGRSIPESVRRATTAGIIEHGNRHFAGRYAEIVIRYRAQLCYVDANLEPAPPPAAGSNTLELCRLRFLGPDRWSLAVYRHAHERYEPSVFADGDFVGRAEDGFDLAANLYLQ